MKNKKILGIPIMAFIIGLVVLGGVSAALVDYLSNEAVVTMSVELPMLFEVSDEGNTWITGNPATLALGSIYGGESTTFFARDSNLANVDTIGDSSKIVTCDTGVTCEDFVSVMAQTITRVDGVVQSTGGVYDLIDLGLCTVLDVNTIAFNYGAVGNPLVVGQADTTEITVTFQPNAIGDYIFTLQKMAQN